MNSFDTVLIESNEESEDKAEIKSEISDPLALNEPMIEHQEMIFNSSDTETSNHDAMIVEENQQNTIVESSNDGNKEKYTDLLNNCKVCGEKWFTTQLQLETHLSEKHGLGSIQCLQCDYVAIDRFVLAYHCRKFHQKKLPPDICRYCSLHFKMTELLVIHERKCLAKRLLWDHVA